MSLARCPDCLRQFATKRRLSIHRRSAHPEKYHLENVPKERKKARWGHEEMVLLACREIDLLAAGEKLNVNKALAEAFPSRTLEAIKGVRKRPAYKELLRPLTSSPGTQDGASSLPSEGPLLGSEARKSGPTIGRPVWKRRSRNQESTWTDSGSTTSSLVFHLIG